MIKSLFLILIPLFSHAWTIEKIKGTVTVYNGQTSSPVKEGQVLSVEETLITGPNARALLKENNSTLWIGAETRFKMTSLPSNLKKQMQLMSGKMRVHVDKIEASTYEFKVPTAVIGVRGTEFFLSVLGHVENICVLEGFVEAEVHEQKYLIEQNYGVKMLLRGEPQMLVNDPLQVQQWVAETSLDNAFISSYSNLSPRMNPKGDFKNFNTLQYNYCQTTGNLPEQECHRTRLLSQWVWRDQWTLTPAVYGVRLKKDDVIDMNPEYRGNSYTQTTLHELSYQKKQGDWQGKLGLFPYEWNDGFILSSQKYTHEPLAMTGVQAQYVQQNDISYELILSKGVAGGQPLQGLNPWNIAGFRLIWPKVNIYFLGLKQEDNQYNYAGIYFSEAVKNLGFTGQFTRLSGDDPSSYTQLEIFYNINATTPLRLGWQIQSLKEDFVSPLRENYKLGTSNQLCPTNDCTLNRVKASANLTDSHLFSIEYFNNNSAKEGHYLGHEYDVSYSFHPHLSWEFNASFWSLRQPQDKKSQGINAWVEISF